MEVLFVRQRANIDVLLEKNGPPGWFSVNGFVRHLSIGMGFSPWDMGEAVGRKRGVRADFADGFFLGVDCVANGLLPTEPERFLKLAGSKVGCFGNFFLPIFVRRLDFSDSKTSSADESNWDMGVSLFSLSK